jgi:glycosyltransferase involved in cell wall biosynthesis
MDIHLTVVGGPKSQTYIVPGVTFPTADLFKLLCEQSWISHHASLPNWAVRELIYSHDILLFPTMDESLGWVIAEAGISGLPTIATNVFAIPELVVDGVTGWIIRMTLDQDGRWANIGQRGVYDAWITEQQSIAVQLEAHLVQAYDNRDFVNEYGKRARQRIVKWYSTRVAERRLSALYASAVD